MGISVGLGAGWWIMFIILAFLVGGFVVPLILNKLGWAPAYMKPAVKDAEQKGGTSSKSNT